MERSLGRFDVYFVCFIISDLNISDTPENTALHAWLERESRHHGEEGELEKKNRKLEGSGKEQR